MPLAWQKNKKKVEAARLKAGEKVRAAWARGAFAQRKNGAQRLDVRVRISRSVRRCWEDGLYDERINGMLGVSGFAHPTYKLGKRQFRDIAFHYHKRECFLQPCSYSQAKIDVHHVDENHDNFLLTNLMPLCVGHHLWENHYERKKAPFVALRKDYQFEAAHILPWHSGHCSRQHGHSYKLSVWVERRMQEQGIAIDFGDISAIVRREIIDRVDHQHLNDLLTNPTAEHILLWFWQVLSVPLKGMVRMRLWETASSCAEITAVQLLRSYGWTKQAEGWAFLQRAEHAAR